MYFFSTCKHKVYKKAKITMRNIIYQITKKINIYGKRVINKLQH